MLVMEPVLAFIALKHELVNVLRIMRLLAIAVTVEEVLVIMILLILIVFLFCVKRATERHTPIPTVAPEVNSRVKFYHIMILMAM
jgi:hypothetical protein